MNKIKGEVICVEKDHIIGRARVKRCGEKVYTPSGKYVGRIVRVFGPVDNPYIKVKIERKWGRNVKEIMIRGGRYGRKR